MVKKQRHVVRRIWPAVNKRADVIPYGVFLEQEVKGYKVFIPEETLNISEDPRHLNHKRKRRSVRLVAGPFVDKEMAEVAVKLLNGMRKPKPKRPKRSKPTQRVA